MRYNKIERWAAEPSGEINPAVREASIKALATSIGWDSREENAKSAIRISLAILYLAICAASGIVVFLQALKIVSMTDIWSERFWETFKYLVIGLGARYVFGSIVENETLQHFLANKGDGSA